MGWIKFLMLFSARQGMEKIRNAPKRFRRSRLESGEVTATIVEFHNPVGMENYKIAQAVQPDYEYLEIHPIKGYFSI